MRDGEIPLCSECHAQIPPERGKCARTCSPACRRRRDERLRCELDTGTSPGAGAPSPDHRGSPPIHGSRAERTTGRRIPQPEPPTEPPLPINDPTAVLRRRLLAEAEALMALPHVEAVTIHRAGHLTVLRVGPPGESVVDVLLGLGQMQGAVRSVAHGADDGTPPSFREYVEQRTGARS